MSKHTPGPWVVVGSLTKYVEARLVGRLIQEVAACGPTIADEGYGQQQEANARLIAAAPALLEALKAVHALVSEGAAIGFNPLDGDWAERLFLSQRQTYAAISQAEGRDHG